MSRGDGSRTSSRICHTSALSPIGGMHQKCHALHGKITLNLHHFVEGSQHAGVNSAHVHDSRSGLPQHVVAGAILPSSIPDTRVGTVRVQPDWIGCDLRSYRLRLAETAAERMAACRLRFRVFNLELGEGLPESYMNGMDQDAYDAVCEHLLVEEKATGRIVGTYRMQSGVTAWRHRGYYGAQEFDFRPYEGLRPHLLELGRACIERDHRSGEVLTLLWARHRAVCRSSRTALPDWVLVGAVAGRGKPAGPCITGWLPSWLRRVCARNRPRAIDCPHRRVTPPCRRLMCRSC